MVISFIQRFPNFFFRNDTRSVYHRLYRDGCIDIIKRLLEIPENFSEHHCKYSASYFDKETISVRSVRDIFLRGIILDLTHIFCFDNCVDSLEYLINKYYDRIGRHISYIMDSMIGSHLYSISRELIMLLAKMYPDIDIFGNKFYRSMMILDNGDILKFMIDNFDHHDTIIREYMLIHVSINPEISKIIIEYLLKKYNFLDVKNTNLSCAIINCLFVSFCKCDDFKSAYKLKCVYPNEINIKYMNYWQKSRINRIIRDEKNVEMANWLKNDCPINCSITKSAKNFITQE